MAVSDAALLVSSRSWSQAAEIDSDGSDAKTEELLQFQMSINVTLNQGAFDDAVEDGAAPVIRNFMYDLRNRMVVSFNEPKSGREYKRGSRVHRASAPGESPAVDTGNLQNSIDLAFPTPIKGILTIAAEYASLLEDGTGRIAPRPFVAPALKGALEQLT